MRQLKDLPNWQKKQMHIWLWAQLRSLGKGGSLYCSLLYFSPEGKLLGVHRKLKPTGSERIIWAEGDGSDLKVYPTNFGLMGGLICWGKLYASG